MQEFHGKTFMNFREELLQELEDAGVYYTDELEPSMLNGAAKKFFMDEEADYTDYRIHCPPITESNIKKDKEIFNYYQEGKNAIKYEDGETENRVLDVEIKKQMEKITALLDTYHIEAYGKIQGNMPFSPKFFISYKYSKNAQHRIDENTIIPTNVVVNDSVPIAYKALTDKFNLVQEFREIVSNGNLNVEEKAKQVKNLLAEKSDILSQHRDPIWLRFLKDLANFASLNFSKIGKSDGGELVEDMRKLLRPRS